MRPISCSNRCKFSFYVSFDEIGFKIVSGGNSWHVHHPRLHQEEIVFPTALLKQEDKEIIHNFGSVGANLGVARNLIERRSGKLIQIPKLRWLSGLCDDLNTVDGIESLLQQKR